MAAAEQFAVRLAALAAHGYSPPCFFTNGAFLVVFSAAVAVRRARGLRIRKPDGYAPSLPRAAGVPRAWQIANAAAGREEQPTPPERTIPL